MIVDPFPCPRQDGGGGGILGWRPISTTVGNLLLGNFRAVVFVGERLPSACPVRYLCIKYPVSNPKFILT